MPIGPDEVAQIKRYGRTVVDSNEFDKTTTRWDLFLVSGSLGKDAEFERGQTARDPACVYEKDNLTIWVVIDKARREMQLVRDHLQMNSEELTASEYLRESFLVIFDEIEARKANRKNAKA